MSLERLSDYIGKSYNKGFLSKIFLGQRLEQEIKKTFKEEIRVIVRADEIHIICKNPSQAKFFNLKKRGIYAIIAGVFLSEARKYTLKIRVGN